MWLLSETQDSLLNGIMVLIHHSDVCEKNNVLLEWKLWPCNLHTGLDTRETLDTKVADTTAPQRVPGDIGAFAISKTFQTQEEIV